MSLGLPTPCPPVTVLYMPEVFSNLDDFDQSGQTAPLRRQCGKGGGSADRDGTSGGADDPDHLQYVPPASQRIIFQRGTSPPSGNSGASTALLRHAHRQIDQGEPLRGG